MKNIFTKAKKKSLAGSALGGVFKNDVGAIDLASIMVGIIVIGLIGGTIAATVFAVIPWTQDNAAKHQLESIKAAENAYFGLSSAVPSPLPAGSRINSFANSAELQAANLLTTGTTYCVTTVDGKDYTGYSKSASGKIWSSTGKNSESVIFTGTLPTDCQFINDGAVATDPTTPYVDPTPTTTTLTYRCDTNTTGSIPMQGNLVGKETWDDGSAAVTYNLGANATAKATAKTLTANKDYKVTFEGTYSKFNANGTGLGGCLISVDHWGMNTGVTDATFAFWNSTKLVDVPAHIPSTITKIPGVFFGATVFNDPDVGQWDVSKVTDLSSAFSGATTFNQSLSSWDTSKVTIMNSTFSGATNFNQPLNNWNTTNVTDMLAMFMNAKEFNQPLDNWTTSNVTRLSQMFDGATKFDGSLDNWNTSNVLYMSSMFSNASSFDQPLNHFDVSKVTDFGIIFRNAAKFNQPLNNWNTGNATAMNLTFSGATKFNQNLSGWNVAKVTARNNFSSASALTPENLPKFV